MANNLKWFVRREVNKDVYTLLVDGGNYFCVYRDTEYDVYCYITKNFHKLNDHYESEQPFYFDGRKIFEVLFSDKLAVTKERG